MVSRALKLTIKAYVEQIIQVFPYSFVTADFFAVISKKNYVVRGVLLTCDVNCFNFSFNLEYKVSLSFEYTNFCLIIYLKIFPTTCTYYFQILIKSTTFQHVWWRPPPSSEKDHLHKPKHHYCKLSYPVQTVKSMSCPPSTQNMMSTDTRHPRSRCGQDVEADTCKIFGIMATIKLYLQTAFRDNNTVFRLLIKKHQEKYKNSQIYKFISHTCKNSYVGQTSSCLRVRINEHQIY